MRQNTVFLLKKMKNTLKKQKKINNDLKININNMDKNKVWAFCSGQFSNDFRGNPKYLFIYINKYRKDITAYWLCNNINLVNEIRKLGYQAYQIGTSEAEIAASMTGVLVCEQVKMEIPTGLENVKYLNLWHGVGGVKDVERSIDDGVLLEQLAKKYIDKNEYYRENELYLAPSKIIEDIALKQLGLTKKQIINAGYPRNIYQRKYERISTFDFNNITSDLPEDTKIVAYTPTYRNNDTRELFLRAIPDIEKLIKVCEENHLLFIFKMHPFLEKEASFLNAKEKYQDCKWFLFWDNSLDFYEIMDRIDLCIFDFSSIFTDFIASGTKHFIRYNFDFEAEDLEFPFAYDEITLGKKCKTFEELLKSLASFTEIDLTDDLKRVNNLFWEYNTDNDMDKIIEQTIKFEPLKLNLPCLYSYDIFDTLIARKGVEPISIFYYVKEKMDTNKYDYPKYLIDNFPKIRKNAELNVREYYNRTINERNDTKCEIKLVEIYDRIKSLYNITDEAASALMDLEIEGELENVIPIKKNIDTLKEQLKKKNKVILISDMYLPEEIIKKMLDLADPILGELDLYLSSTLGYQKSKKTLYLEVYKKYGIHYNFKKWIHTGDNEHSDNKMAKSLNIETIKIDKLEFNNYEKELVKKINTYDAYLVAGLLARFRDNHPKIKANFAYGYVSLLFVPYIYWAIHDSINNNYENAYFISRDGHHLKKIADKIIEIEKLNINTKYIYASRKTWRVPSFIDEIDSDFWSTGHGNFTDIKTFDKLLKALSIQERKFDSIFPELSYLKDMDEISKTEMSGLIKIFQTSEKYQDYLLTKASLMRESSCGYLKQVMDPNKKFSIIEYWGRGYTQENFTRLWHHITGKKDPVVFYYSRSTLPSIDYNIRKNYIENNSSQSFIEAIFNCINYKSIEKYEYQDKLWVPVIKEKSCDYELFKALEEYLVLFASDYTNLRFLNRDSIGRSLIDFAINYYNEFPSDDLFTKVLGHLKDSIFVYGEEKEIAPAITHDDLTQLEKGHKKMGELTKNPTISFNRSNYEIKERILEIYQTTNNPKITLNNLLSKKELLKDKANKEKIASKKEVSLMLNRYYEQHLNNTTVKNKILVLTPNAYFDDLGYSDLFNALSHQDKFEVKKYALKYHFINYSKLALDIAEAKYIILKKPIGLFHELNIREETKIIILAENPLNYFSKGLMKKDKIKSRMELSKYDYKIKTDILQIPSNILINGYNNIYNVSDETKFLETGNVLTDCYFNQDQKTYLRAKLNKFFKAAKGKKVICYIPYSRYVKKKSKQLNYLNMKLLEKYLKDEYVVIINQSSKKTSTNVLNIKGFSKDLTGTFSAKEQMLMADIIVGDYRDTAFEAPLLNIPVFISSFDKRTINSKDNTLMNFNDIIYGVEITSTKDLINKIKDIDSYDYKISQKFKQKYFTNCKGNSAQELVKYILNDKN